MSAPQDTGFSCGAKLAWAQSAPETAMDALVTAITAFPTNALSILMVAAVLYWLLVIIGALDIDLLHFDHDIGHDHDVGGHHDSGSDHDSHAGYNPNVILEFLRIGKVPLTLIASLFVFSAWSVSLASTTVLRPMLPGWSWWFFGGLTLIAAAVIAFLATGIILAPLAKLFSLEGEHAANDLIGKMVEVTSSTVDPRFGTARYDRPTGEDVILNVICDARHILKRGDQAVVMEYDRATGVYRIAPLPHTLPGFDATLEPTLPPTDPQPAQPPRQPQ